MSDMLCGSDSSNRYSWFRFLVDSNYPLSDLRQHTAFHTSKRAKQNIVLTRKTNHTCSFSMCHTGQFGVLWCAHTDYSGTSPDLEVLPGPDHGADKCMKKAADRPLGDSINKVFTYLIIRKQLLLRESGSRVKYSRFRAPP